PRQEMRLRGGGNGVAQPQFGRPGALLGPLCPPGGPGEPGNLPERLLLAGSGEHVLTALAAVLLGNIRVQHRLSLGLESGRIWSDPSVSDRPRLPLYDV